MMAINRSDEGGKTASIRITVILAACGGAPFERWSARNRTPSAADLEEIAA
jgi:hypothetical protein